MSKIAILRMTSPEEIQELYKQLGTQKAILEHLGLSRDPRAFKLVKDKLGVIHKPQRTAEQLESDVIKLSSSANSITDLLLTLKLEPVGSNFSRVSGLLKKNNIDIAQKPNRKWTDELVYCLNSTFPRRALSTRVRKDGFLTYTCETCSNTGEWNGVALSLQLDHVDGDCTNNIQTNLRWLCPNCHSQTPTYAGKNKKLAG